MYLRLDYVFFIPPPPHHRGTRSAFSPSIDASWYGRVNLIFKIRVRTDAEPDTRPVMECQCALIEILFDYCPREGRNWYPSTAQIGTKLLYCLGVCPLRIQLSTSFHCLTSSAACP